MEVKIKIENLSKKFGTFEVLKSVSLDIYKGEILYVVGKSGSGKSVLLKNITGLLKPDQGKIFIDSVNILEKSEEELIAIRKKMGVLFQMAALFDSMNVFENVAFTLRRFSKFSKNQIKDIVKQKLEMVGMGGMELLFPASLSMGMQKRVGLARAIALEPEIILCDEPTTAVDPLSGAAVDDLIMRLNQELGVTVIIISHDMESAFRTAHRVSMLYQGNFLFTGSVDELKQCEDPVIQQFINGRAEGPIPII